MNSNTLTTSIMRRVFALYIFRGLTSAFSLKAYVIGLSIFSIIERISLSDVLINMSSVKDFFSFYQFNISAILHTDMLVQGALALSMVLVLWLAFDVIFSKPEQSSQAFS